MSQSDTENKAVCTAEDAENIRQYCKHFGIPSTSTLNEALDIFEKDPTYENERNLKLEVSKWMTESEHESFKDALWDAPKQAAEEAKFDLQFDKDVKEHLSDEEAESSES